jgi:hypothetical protein
MVRPIVKNRSYCIECEREWVQNYRKHHPQTYTREQRDRQLEMERKRIANLSPEQQRARLDQKQAGQRKWLAAHPEIRKRRNLEAAKARQGWTPERLEQQKATQKAHYAKLQLKQANNLCGYSINCNEPPLGAQKFCLHHWCRGLRQADLRLKAEYTTEQLSELWLAQKGLCAITGVPLIAGDTASLDHIIPIVRGGTGLIANVRFIHWSINTMKWDQIDTEFKEFILHVCPALIEWAKK